MATLVKSGPTYQFSSGVPWAVLIIDYKTDRSNKKLFVDCDRSTNTSVTLTPEINTFPVSEIFCKLGAVFMFLRTISGPENAGGHTIARLTKCLVRRGSNVFKPTTHPGSNEKPILVKKKKG